MLRLHMVIAAFATAFGQGVLPEPGADGTPSGVRVELLPFLGEHSRAVLLRFRNTTDEPRTVLKPLDGSMWGWYVPVYRFHVTDDTGRALALTGRCGVSGLWAETSWPADYSIRIAPGSTAVVVVDVPYVIKVARSYWVQVEYIVDPDLPERRVRCDEFPLPADAWIGAASSEPIEVRWSTDVQVDAARAIRLPYRIQSGFFEVTPEEVERAQSRCLAAIRSQFSAPIAERDQAALERAQILLAHWDATGYPVERLTEILGDPTAREPDGVEYLFEPGVGWRFTVDLGVVTGVQEIWAS